MRKCVDTGTELLEYLQFTFYFDKHYGTSRDDTLDTLQHLEVYSLYFKKRNLHLTLLRIQIYWNSRSFKSLRWVKWVIKLIKICVILISKDSLCKRSLSLSSRSSSVVKTYTDIGFTVVRINIQNHHKVVSSSSALLWFSIFFYLAPCTSLPVCCPFTDNLALLVSRRYSVNVAYPFVFCR